MMQDEPQLANQMNHKKERDERRNMMMMEAQEMKDESENPNLKIIFLMKTQTVSDIPDRREMKGERLRPHEGSMSALTEYVHRADTSKK